MAFKDGDILFAKDLNGIVEEIREIHQSTAHIEELVAKDLNDIVEEIREIYQRIAHIEELENTVDNIKEEIEKQNSVRNEELEDIGTEITAIYQKINDIMKEIDKLK